MPDSPLPWPPALVGTPAVAVIERAIERRRLGDSLLLHGDSLEILNAVANAIADRLLNPRMAGRPAVHFPPDKHPDCFTLRPAGKMRIIAVEATRDLIGNLQVTASGAGRKVAIIHEADRMNTAAANIFLKTLEEPPANSTILLLTTHPYTLLPTILSRCLQFRFVPAKDFHRRDAEDAEKATGSLRPPRLRGDDTSEMPNPSPEAKENPWPLWLADYQAALTRIAAGAPDKRSVADHLFSIYGLLSRFKLILENEVSAAWAKEKESLPPDLEDDEQTAIETGLAAGLRLRLFAEIEEATRAFALPRLAAGDESVRRSFTAAIERLEHGIGLLRVNLNESAVLEDFLLTSLRLWTKR